MTRPRLLPIARCLALLVFAGCASTPDAAVDAETAMSCDDLSVAVPDIATLNSVTPRRDVQNWMDVTARQTAGEIRMERRKTQSAWLALEVRPDGSVARACVARYSSNRAFARSWLQAISVARFRPDVIREKGSWLRLEGR